MPAPTILQQPRGTDVRDYLDSLRGESPLPKQGEDPRLSAIFGSPDPNLKDRFKAWSNLGRLMDVLLEHGIITIYTSEEVDKHRRRVADIINRRPVRNVVGAVVWLWVAVIMALSMGLPPLLHLRLGSALSMFAILIAFWILNATRWRERVWEETPLNRDNASELLASSRLDSLEAFSVAYTNFSEKAKLCAKTPSYYIERIRWEDWYLCWLRAEFVYAEGNIDGRWLGITLYLGGWSLMTSGSPNSKWTEKWDIPH
ncbi:MAG: hypothetical protein V1826_00145 [bacterium]